MKSRPPIRLEHQHQMKEKQKCVKEKERENSTHLFVDYCRPHEQTPHQRPTPFCCDHHRLDQRRGRRTIFHHRSQNVCVHRPSSSASSIRQNKATVTTENPTFIPSLSLSIFVMPHGDCDKLPVFHPNIETKWYTFPTTNDIHPPIFCIATTHFIIIICMCIVCVHVSPVRSPHIVPMLDGLKNKKKNKIKKRNKTDDDDQDSFLSTIELPGKQRYNEKCGNIANSLCI